MRCPHCPIPADRRCKGESHRRLCDLRDRDHPDFNEAYLQPIAGEDGAVVRTASEAATAADDARMGLYKRMHGCRFRRPLANQCPDCRGLCTRGDDPAVAERADCFACLEADAHAPEPVRP